MDSQARTEASKFLSSVLRHRPDAVGLALDPQGWVEVEALLAAAAAHGRPLTRAELEEVVATSPKQRFALSPDGARIRAKQGHTVAVDLGLEARVPPDVLFHGTARRNLASIEERGIARGERHHVHLSEDEGVAWEVGRRWGEAVVLRVDARGMVAEGREFFRAENGVWLTEGVEWRFVVGVVV